mgnify:CR=1 FL=1
MTDTIEAAPPPRSVEEVKAMLESTEKGGVRNSIQNCLTVFQYDPVLSGAVAKNLLTERIDLLKPIGRKRRTGSKAMTDTDMKYIRLYLEKTYGLTSEKKIADAADLAADANSYHPIRDYLSGLVWDGKERIRYCLRHFLGADTDNFTYHSLRLFLLGAIHRAFCPGCKFEVMLCLVGGQGAGKSTFFRLLAVKDEWFSDDLRKLDDDNVYRKLQGHWIIEMSEMIATANAKSIEEIKSFLSRQKEVYKIPYETHPEDRLRQARGVKADLLATLGKWCKAQCILLGVTFCELLAGLLLMRQGYALLLAALIAVIDALPVFGTGTVLVPWGALCLLTGNVPKGLGLLALYGVISLVRSVLEPKIMAAQVDLSPLAALAAMYVGFCAFGVAGMVLCPMALLFVKQLHDSGWLRLWK